MRDEAFVRFGSIFRSLPGRINKKGRWRISDDWLQAES